MAPTPTPERRSNSVLVSLKELRKIETHRVHRKEEGERLRERKEQEVREAAARAAQEAQQRRERERARMERREQEQRERAAREERLRLAEAERRARVEAELELERKRVEMRMVSRPRSSMPWLAVVATALVLGVVVALLAMELQEAFDRNEDLRTRIQRIRSRSADDRKTAHLRIASLNDQVGQLRTHLIEAAKAPSPPKSEHVIKTHRPRKTGRRTTKPPGPLLSPACIKSDDPLSPACVGKPSTPQS